MPVEAHEINLLECPPDDSAPHETRCPCGCQTQPETKIEKDVSRLFEHTLLFIVLCGLVIAIARC